MNTSEKNNIIKYIEKNDGVLKAKVVEKFSYLGIDRVETFINESKEIIKKDHKDGIKLYVKKKGCFGCFGCLGTLAIILIIGFSIMNMDSEEKDKEVVAPVTAVDDKDKKSEEDKKKAAEASAAKEKQEQEEKERIAREEQAKKEQAERERQEQLKKEQAERERQEQAKKEQEERERQEQEAAEQAEEEAQAASTDYSIDKDCGDFSAAGEATAFMNASVAAGFGDHRLDRDGDGVACDD